jgi:hypothetical protein
MSSGSFKQTELQCGFIIPGSATVLATNEEKGKKIYS